MDLSANQQFWLGHLHDVLMLKSQNALSLLPFIHQHATDRAFQL